MNPSVNGVSWKEVLELFKNGKIGVEDFKESFGIFYKKKLSEKLRIVEQGTDKRIKEKIDFDDNLRAFMEEGVKAMSGEGFISIVEKCLAELPSNVVGRECSTQERGAVLALLFLRRPIDISDSGLKTCLRDMSRLNFVRSMREQDEGGQEFAYTSRSGIDIGSMERMMRVAGDLIAYSIKHPDVSSEVTDVISGLGSWLNWDGANPTMADFRPAEVGRTAAEYFTCHRQNLEHIDENLFNSIKPEFWIGMKDSLSQQSKSWKFLSKKLFNMWDDGKLSNKETGSLVKAIWLGAALPEIKEMLSQHPGLNERGLKMAVDEKYDGMSSLKSSLAYFNKDKPGMKWMVPHLERAGFIKEGVLDRSAVHDMSEDDLSNFLMGIAVGIEARSLKGLIKGKSKDPARRRL